MMVNPCFAQSVRISERLDVLSVFSSNQSTYERDFLNAVHRYIYTDPTFDIWKKVSGRWLVKHP